jgi:MFS family permease
MAESELSIEPVAPAAESDGALGPLRLPDFRWLIAGTTLSNGAQWIQQVTLSWLVYDLTSSGTMLGTMNLVRAVATLGLAALAGLAIDRFARSTLMLVVNGWLLSISLILGVALLSGYTEIWPLFVYSFLGGVAQAVDMPLRQTVVFVLVPRRLAPAAVALVQTGWAVMRSLGPAVGGFLILWFGPGGNFLVQASAYGLIALTILRIRFPPEPRVRGQGAARGALVEGLKFVVTQPTTRAFVLMGWVLPLFIIPTFSALPPIFAKTVFEGGPDILGMLLSAVGLGGIVGGLVSASLSAFERRGVLQLAALLMLSLSLIGFGLSADLLAALALLAVAGFFEMIYLTTNQTLLQLSIPDALRGRVTSILSLNAGLSPIGALVAGVGADLIGPQVTTFILSGIAGLIAVAVYLGSPTVRDYRMSRALAAEPRR